MKILLGIGNPICDLTAMVDDDKTKALGLNKGDQAHADMQQFTAMLKEVQIMGRTAGGSIANTVVALAHLGTPTRFAGGLGEDDLGEFFAEELREAGVDDACVRVKDSITGSCLCLITSDGERTMATCLGAAAGLEPSHLEGALFDNVGWVYVSGYLAGHGDLMMDICRQAREVGAKIVFDAGAPGMINNFRQVFDDVLPQVDILFVNEDEAKALTGREPEEAIRELAGGREVTVVKLGGEGSLVMADGKLSRISTTRIEAVDTTGAGDTYAAGFLYKYIHGADAVTAAHFASHLAAKVVAQIGARFTKEEWAAMLKELEK
ncbi:MAG: adenosine kinase [Planctomycetota bacterium]|nr:MAG: adenosine kinase [Planctomycetota bacterium]